MLTVKDIRKTNQKSSWPAGLVLCCIIGCLLFSWLPLTVYATTQAELTAAAQTDESRIWPDLADINAASWLVADAETGEIIISHAADLVLYPASVTKIMTAVLLIESERLEQTVIVSETAVDLDYDMAKVGFIAGETVYLRDVMYALMLASGNDAARIVAESLAGSEAAFADMMNAKAASLGMQDTHFRNPSGLHDPEHVTTASDILILIQYALEIPLFRDLVSTRIYAMPATDLHPFSAWAMLQNTNRFLIFGDNVLSSPYYQSYTGIKTGTTRAAGYCLTVLAQTWDGRELVLILFGVPTSGPFAQLYQFSYSLLNEAAKQLELPDQPPEPEPTPTIAITETLMPETTRTEASADPDADPDEEDAAQNGDAGEVTDAATLLTEDIWRTAFFILLTVSFISSLLISLYRRRS